LLRVAAALALFLHAHHAAPARLDVQPQLFSPSVAPLRVSAELPRPAVAGVRLAPLGGRALGWLLPLRNRERIALTWHGRLAGRRVPDGRYQLQLVVGKRTVARADFLLDATAPSLTGFRATNGGRPFAGDSALVTTISPEADTGRTTARIAFTLSEPAAISVQILAPNRRRRTVTTIRQTLAAGRRAITWTPDSTIEPRTYLLLVTATDAAGNRRRYGAETPYVDRYARAPVVRVLGVEADFDRQSYAPGDTATLRVSTDAVAFTLGLFRAPGAKPLEADDQLSGTAVTELEQVDWMSHEDAPGTIEVPIGADWPSGLYFAELNAVDGRIGYAPFVVRPAELGANSRIAVVLPTHTWQAYNFYDADGDGWGDTWYAGRSDLRVSLDRPYVNRGVPPKVNAYEIPFLIWMARAKLPADVLSEEDLEAVASGRDLAELYDLIVFPGHTEYVTTHEYDLVEQYRDAGGNLIFLSANNFFRKVVERNGVLTRLAPWRELGRPEAALIGTQYRANDEGQHQAPFVVRNTAATPWLWQGLGLDVGSLFGRVVGGFGVEIDATTRDSPRGTVVLAEIPDLLGPGVTAQMTYYQTRGGAKVFAAGALDFVTSALTYPVNHLLLNLWRRLVVP
jgi:hypothetical protein